MTPFLLQHLWTQAAERTPDAPALSDGKRVLTYAELDRETRAVAGLLQSVGVAPGDRVATWADKSTAVLPVLGILKAGAAYVPLDPTIPEARAALMLRRASVRTLFTTPERATLLGEAVARGELPDLEQVVLSSAEPCDLGAVAKTVLSAEYLDAFREPSVTEQHLAYVLHTSGSTGAPKGVAISHRNALTFVTSWSEHFGFSASDKFACHAPLHFDLSVFDLYCAFSAGAEVALLPEYFSAFPKKIVDLLVSKPITIWNSVVSALSLLFEKGNLAGRAESLGAMRAIFFSGERMPIPLLRRLRATFSGASLINVYGQTEANSSMAYRVDAIPDDDAAALPLGEALPNFETFLLSPENDLVTAPETEGELCVRAATVASGGYLGDPERTREKFVLDPIFPERGTAIYKTGDLAKRTLTGSMVLVGRKDDMIKTRGFRVELGEIEAALFGCEIVREAAVLAIADPLITHRLVACVLLAEGIVVGDVEKHIASDLAKKLPPYMIPETIVIRTELPRTSSGKIDRNQLKSEVS